jgi:tripartite-type tricarboxylate transporter receptor subunit TctC
MKLLRLAALAAVAMGAAFAHAQGSWPTKTVKIIVGFPPGGSTDQVARVLGGHLTTTLGQQFIVENRPGASASIAAGAVAAAPPDGYTIGVVFDTHAVNPSVIPNLPFNTEKDLASVMLIGVSPMAIVTQASQPYKNFREVLAAAKAKPGSVAIGSIGSGSLGHLAIAQMGNLLNLELTHIPYKGGGPLMTDALGGQVPFAIGSAFLVNPHVKGGKLKALAVTSAKASPAMPGVATVAEQGVPGFSALSWWGVIAPAGMPPAVTKKLVEELQKALKVPAIAEKLQAQGMEIVGSGPEEADRFVKGEIARWAKVVKDNKIKAGD